MHRLTELSSGNWSQYSNITIIPKTSWIKVLIRFWINYLSKRAYFYDSFVLPYLGNISLGLKTRLRQTTERDLRYCKLKVIFRSKCRLNTLFWSKDSLEKKNCSRTVYRYTWKTFGHFYTRVTVHRISNLTGKRPTKC